MILNHCFKTPSLILMAALFIVSVSSPVLADSPVIVSPDGELTYLDTPGTDPIVVTGINNAGRVSGYFNAIEPRAFITGPNGVGLFYVGPEEGGEGFRAQGINDSGQVAGDTGPISSIAGFITGPNGMGATKIAQFPERFDYHISGINDVGQVVGSFHPLQGRVGRAFITAPNGVGITDLGTLGGAYSAADSINSSGQVTGSSYLAGDRIRHAFITGPDGMDMRDLGTLGVNSSSASGINDAGQVVGGYQTAEGDFHAFITGPDGIGMRDLGGERSFALGINDAGQVVGWSSETVEGPTHAFITGTDGMGMSDLNSLVDLPNGVILTEAIDINNRGQILAYVTAPIPEPETYALMLAGLGLIGFVAGRNKAKNGTEASYL